MIEIQGKGVFNGKGFKIDKNKIGRIAKYKGDGPFLFYAGIHNNEFYFRGFY